MLRRLRAIAFHPATPFLLILYFALDFACLWLRFTHGTAAPRVSMAAYQILDFLGADPGTALHDWPFSTRFVLDDQGKPVKRDGIDRSTPGYFAHCNILTINVAKGAYAPTTQLHRCKLRVFEKMPRSDPGVVEVVAQTTDDYITKYSGRWEHPDRLRAALTSPTQTYAENHHLPLGYLHNSLSLLMFAMLCWSLRLNIPKLWRERNPTKCPHCRNNTIGLTTDTCPERGNCISCSD